MPTASKNMHFNANCSPLLFITDHAIYFDLSFEKYNIVGSQMKIVAA
jgi:hypothetical protein